MNLDQNPNPLVNMEFEPKSNSNSSLTTIDEENNEVLKIPQIRVGS